jgi:AcrR family transcriptional regulator
MDSQFRNRFLKLFDNASMAEIARRLNIPHATVRNYFGGRLPATEVLIKIADETGVSLNWLLLGRGEVYTAELAPVNIGRLFEEKIEELIDQKLAKLEAASRHKTRPQNGIDEFDVEKAIDLCDDPQIIMGDWLRHEGRQFPADYGVVFFRGWASFTRMEKIDALLDAKKALDRELRSSNS